MLALGEMSVIVTACKGQDQAKFPVAVKAVRIRSRSIPRGARRSASHTRSLTAGHTPSHLDGRAAPVGRMAIVVQRHRRSGVGSALMRGPSGKPLRRIGENFTNDTCGLRNNRGPLVRRTTHRAMRVPPGKGRGARGFLRASVRCRFLLRSTGVITVMTAARAQAVLAHGNLVPPTMMAIAGARGRMRMTRLTKHAARAGPHRT